MSDGPTPSQALRLLPGGLSEPIDEWDLDLPVLHRPGDLIEPIAVDAATSRRLHGIAARGRIPVLMACTLVVELHLAVSDLQERGASACTPTLDATARNARPAEPLSASTAKYLRALSTGRSARPGLPSPIGLPTRIVRRVSAQTLSAAIETADLPRARAWERAAVIDGRTLTEWALACALLQSSASADEPRAGRSAHGVCLPE